MLANWYCYPPVLLPLHPHPSSSSSPLESLAASLPNPLSYRPLPQPPFPLAEVESFGLVSLEGMAASLPLLSSQNGGSSNFVVHGDTGLLHPPPSVGAASDSALTQHILQLDRRAPGGRQLAHHMGAAACRKAHSDFSPPLFFAVADALLRRVAQAAGQADADFEASLAGQGLGLVAGAGAGAADAGAGAGAAGVPVGAATQADADLQASLGSAAHLTPGDAAAAAAPAAARTPARDAAAAATTTAASSGLTPEAAAGLPSGWAAAFMPHPRNQALVRMEQLRRVRRSGDGGSDKAGTQLARASPVTGLCCLCLLLASLPSPHVEPPSPFPCLQLGVVRAAPSPSVGWPQQQHLVCDWGLPVCVSVCDGAPLVCASATELRGRGGVQGGTCASWVWNGRRAFSIFVYIWGVRGLPCGWRQGSGSTHARLGWQPQRTQLLHTFSCP